MKFASLTIPSPSPFAAIAGLRIDRLQSAEIFADCAGLGDERRAQAIAHACQDRWADFAASLAAMPEPLELLFVLGSAPGAPGERDELTHAILAIGRGKTEEEAHASVARDVLNARLLAVTHLDYADVRSITDPAELATIASHVVRAHAVEVRRRLEWFELGHGVVERTRAGFGGGSSQTQTQSAASVPGVLHLVPWQTSLDPWRRLVSALDAEPEGVAVITHAMSCPEAPESVRELVRRELATTESLLRGDVGARGASTAVLAEAVGVLRSEVFKRMSLLSGPLVAARTFITGAAGPSAALQAVVASSLDDAYLVEHHGPVAGLRGGVELERVASADVVSPFGEPGIASLFGPREATAILRTVAPNDDDALGLGVIRSRTGLFAGTSGEESVLGESRHGGRSFPVAQDHESRFRHTYVIGQTGTGKSTMLNNMIMHDIRAGRGVCVVDPHGSLIEDILGRIPRSRVDDVVLVDPANQKRPVGFNFLYINVDDPEEYVRQRDLVIDDMFAYFKRNFRSEHMGPVFETYFRTAMLLILGAERPPRELVPNILWIFEVFRDEDARQGLLKRVQGRDVMIDVLVDQMQRAGSDMSIANVAPWVTSKFTRFAADVSLRRMTCQPECLDLGGVIRDKRILLFNLARGQFGEVAAGLLTSMIVSRLWAEVLRRGPGNGPPFYLYVDEFQTIADERFATLLAEARKFGLSLTVAHQYTKQIDENVFDAVLGNVGTSVVFRVGYADAQQLGPAFGPRFGARDLCSLPNFKAYMRAGGSLGGEAFSLDTAAPLPPGNPELAQALRDLSALAYGRDATLIDGELRASVAALRGLNGPSDQPTGRSRRQSIF